MKMWFSLSAPRGTEGKGRGCVLPNMFYSKDNTLKYTRPLPQVGTYPLIQTLDGYLTWLVIYLFR